MRKMKYLLIASLIAFVASPALAVEIGGYVDIGIFDIEGDGTNYNSGIGTAQTPEAEPTTNRNLLANTGNTTIAIGEVNLDVSADLTDNISVMVSMDATSNNALNVSVDKAYVDFVNPGPADITLRIGKAESILGLTARQVESNQIESISHSMLSEWTIDNVNGAPAAVQVLGSFAPLNYALSVANATYGRLEDRHGAEVGNVNGNNQMTFAGNLGVVPIEGLEIGIFGEFGANANTNEAVGPGGAGAGAGVSGNDSDHELYGVYAEYAYGPFKVAAEFLESQEEISTGTLPGIDDNEIETFYIYGSYDVTSELTAWIRYGEADFGGETTDKAGVAIADNVSNAALADMERFAAGVSYDIADNVTVKLEYQDNDEDSVGSVDDDITYVADADQDDNVLAASLVCSF